MMNRNLLMLVALGGVSSAISAAQVNPEQLAALKAGVDVAAKNSVSAAQDAATTRALMQKMTAEAEKPGLVERATENIKLAGAKGIEGAKSAGNAVASGAKSAGNAVVSGVDAIGDGATKAVKFAVNPFGLTTKVTNWCSKNEVAIKRTLVVAALAFVTYKAVQYFKNRNTVVIEVTPVIEVTHEESSVIA